MLNGFPRVLLALIVVATSLAGTVSPALAQERSGRGRGPRGDVARLFDRYALKQAQEVLALEDGQVERFTARFRALQEARRRHLADRRAVLRDLQRLTERRTDAAEPRLLERLRALDAADAKGRASIERALAEVDEVLTVGQRARFRLLEEHLERRKLELMLRARRGAGRLPPR